MNPLRNTVSARKPKVVFTLDTPYSETKWYLVALFFRAERMLTYSTGLLYQQKYSQLSWTYYAGTYTFYPLSVISKHYQYA